MFHATWHGLFIHRCLVTLYSMNLKIRTVSFWWNKPLHPATINLLKVPNQLTLLHWLFWQHCPQDTSTFFSTASSSLTLQLAAERQWGASNHQRISPGYWRWVCSLSERLVISLWLSTAAASQIRCYRADSGALVGDFMVCHVFMCFTLPLLLWHKHWLHFQRLTGMPLLECWSVLMKIILFTG